MIIKLLFTILLALRSSANVIHYHYHYMNSDQQGSNLGMKLHNNHFGA